MSAAPPNAAGRIERAAPPRYQPLVIVLAAVAAGIVIDRCWTIPLAVWWSAAVAGVAAWWVLWRSAGYRSAAVALLAAAAAVAGGWHHCSWRLFDACEGYHYAYDVPEPACLDVIATRMPRQGPPPKLNPLQGFAGRRFSRMEVELQGVRDGDVWRSACGRAKVHLTGAVEGIWPGDRLRVFARIARLQAAENPGEFDFAEHFRADRLCAVVQVSHAECIEPLATGSTWNLRRWLEWLRSRGVALLQRHLNQERADLAALLLLDEGDAFEPERNEAFLVTGTIHVLSISGLHVAVLAGAMTLLFELLFGSRRWAVFAVAMVIVAYMLLVDSRPPVMRATVLVVTMAVAVWLGRQPLSFNTLAAAALIVLAVNPAELFRIGAQLSFLSAAMLAWMAARAVHRHRQDPLRRLEEANWTPAERLRGAILRNLGDGLFVGAAIWVVTAPLVLARFHIFSLSALFLNLAISIPASLGLMTGFATITLGAMCEPLGVVTGTLCDLSLGAMEWIVQVGSRAPGGHLWSPGPPTWWLVGFYAAVGIFAAFPRVRPPGTWIAAALCGWIALGFGVSLIVGQSRGVQATFVSVGHGCAVVVRLPGGETLLYDAGRMGPPQRAARATAATLWDKGVKHLDAIVLSHADVDHYNAVPELLDRFTVGTIYVSPVMFERRSAALMALKEAIDHRGVPLREIHAGDRLAARGCRVEVLHPPKRGTLGSDNANSVVLLVEHAGRRLLLTGDLEPPGLNELLAEEPLHCDVILMPHHGSRSSNPQGLARWSSPGHVVISGTHRFDTRPIEAKYRAAGAQVSHTARVGAIDVRLGRQGTEISAFLAGRSRRLPRATEVDE